MRVPSDFEFMGLRKYAHRWFDEIFLPWSLDWVPRGGELRGEKHKALIPLTPFIPFIESLEQIIYNLFTETPLWSHLVWGQRDDYQKLADEYLGFFYPSNAGHYNTEDLIRGVTTDPSDWLDTPSTLVPTDIYLAHILATVPSEVMTEAKVREFKDFSFILYFKSLCWDNWLYRYDRYRLSPPAPKPKIPRFF